MPLNSDCSVGAATHTKCNGMKYKYVYEYRLLDRLMIMKYSHKATSVVSSIN